MKEMNENGTLNAYVVCGNEVREGDHYGYKIIAVIQSKFFWCAYMGLTDWSDHTVANQGDTVPYEVAKKLFSTIDAVIPNYNS
jgi:hypothetical protein